MTGTEGAKRDSTTTTRTLMRGTVAPSQIKSAVYLIQSLCAEVGHLGEFRDWDRMYTAAAEVKGGKNCIRLRQNLIGSHSGAKALQLMHLGIADRRVEAPVEKRSVSCVGVGKEGIELIKGMGCVFGYEYVRKGVRYRSRGGYLVEVFVVEGLEEVGVLTSCRPLVGEDRHGVVEVSCEGGDVEGVRAFMKCLEPVVVTSKGSGGGGGGGGRKR